MNLGDSLITIFVIAFVTVIFFIFPLMSTANLNDSVAQVTLKTNLENFVNQICDTGKIQKEDYDKFLERINVGNTYDVQIDVKVLDDTPNKKVVANSGNVGENAYVTYYNSQILDQLYKKDDSGKDDPGVLYLKEGDQVHISIKNTNVTLSQQLMPTLRADISTIVAEKTRECTINGI